MYYSQLRDNNYFYFIKCFNLYKENDTSGSEEKVTYYLPENSGQACIPEKIMQRVKIPDIKLIVK